LQIRLRPKLRCGWFPNSKHLARSRHGEQAVIAPYLALESSGHQENDEARSSKSESSPNDEIRKCSDREQTKSGGRDLETGRIYWTTMGMESSERGVVYCVQDGWLCLDLRSIFSFQSAIVH